MEYLSKNILLLRHLKELTQAEIANQIGFKRTTWVNYESGLSTPILRDALMIAKFLDVNLEDLITKDLSTDTHLIEKYKDSKYWEKTHLKSHPPTHPNRKKEGKSPPGTKIKTTFNSPLNVDQKSLKVIEAHLHDLSSKIAKIETNTANSLAQMEGKIKALAKGKSKK